ncbi:unnamed protein product, partial [Staurois parvus]
MKAAIMLSYRGLLVPYVNAVMVKKPCVVYQHRSLFCLSLNRSAGIGRKSLAGTRGELTRGPRVSRGPHEMPWYLFHSLFFEFGQGHKC